MALWLSKMNRPSIEQSLCVVGEEDLPNMEKQKTLIVDFLARWME